MWLQGPKPLAPGSFGGGPGLAVGTLRRVGCGHPMLLPLCHQMLGPPSGFSEPKWWGPVVVFQLWVKDLNFGDVPAMFSKKI